MNKYLEVAKSLIDKHIGLSSVVTDTQLELLKYDIAASLEEAATLGLDLITTVRGLTDEPA